MRFHLGKRAPNPDARVPGAVHELRDDLEPEAAVVVNDDQLNHPPRASCRRSLIAFTSSCLTKGHASGAQVRVSIVPDEEFDTHVGKEEVHPARSYSIN